MVVVEGRLSYGEERPKLLVERVTPWEVAQKTETVVKVKPQQAEKKNSKLYLKITHQDYDSVCDILDAYVGDIPVVLVFDDGTKKYAPVSIRNAKGLIYELAGLIGESNVKMIDKSHQE